MEIRLTMAEVKEMLIKKASKVTGENYCNVRLSLYLVDKYGKGLPVSPDPSQCYFIVDTNPLKSSKETSVQPIAEENRPVS